MYAFPMAVQSSMLAQDSYPNFDPCCTLHYVLLLQSRSAWDPCHFQTPCRFSAPYNLVHILVTGGHG